MKPIAVALCILVVVVLAGCGGGSGTPQPGYSVARFASNYSGALINSAGQILTVEVDGSGNPLRVVVLNPDQSVTDRSGIPASERLIGFSNGAYVLGQEGMDYFVWSPTDASVQLEKPGLVPNIQTCTPYAVNGGGIAIGVELVDQSTVPAKWDAAGHIHQLQMPDGYACGEARDINDAGVIVGSVWAADDLSRTHTRAVMWDPTGTPTLLDPDNAQSSQALLVNAVGEIAGLLNGTGAVWTAGGQVSHGLQSIGGYDPQPDLQDINDSGIVVGFVQRGFGSVTKAVVWSADGSPDILPSLPTGGLTTAWGIANSGVIVGGCVVEGNAAMSGQVLWTPD